MTSPESHAAESHGSDPAAALEATGVSHRYGRRAPWALHDVELAIPQGSIVALVGSNGAGKSTLMRSWLGFERPTRGRLAVLGADTARERRDAVRQIGYLSQSGGLYPHLAVASHLDLAGTLRREFDADLARSRLEELRIPLGQKVGSLSGGQLKHVELAIVLGTHAPVLILDEPLNGLDALARSEFLRVLSHDMRASGRTALLSSHIIRDIEMVCDRLVVLSNGRVRLHETVADALAQHRLAASPTGGVVAKIRRPDGSSVSLVRSDDDQLAAPNLEDLVMAYLVQAGEIAAEHPAPTGAP